MRIEILKYLSDTDDYKPLNAFMKSIYKGESMVSLNKLLKEMYHGRYNHLNVIEVKGDVQFLGYHFSTWHEHVFGKNPSDNKNDPIGNLDNLEFQARITQLGRKELQDIEFQNSITKVNDSVIRTNKMTLIIAGLAALFSLLAVISPLLKHDTLSVPEIQETNKILQKQSQTLDSLLQSRKIDAAALDSLKTALGK